MYNAMCSSLKRCQANVDDIDTATAPTTPAQVVGSYNLFHLHLNRHINSINHLCSQRAQSRPAQTGPRCAPC